MSIKGIYSIRCSANKKQYIGSSINIENRWKSHRAKLLRGKHWSPIFQNSWNLYGESAFVFSVEEIVEDSNFLTAREQFWIWRTRAYPAGFNCKQDVVSMSGFRHTTTSREKMSKAKKGKPSPKRGISLSEEQKKKMSVARKGIKPTAEAVAKSAAGNRGKKRSAEAGAHISEALIQFYRDNPNRPNRASWSEEARQKASASALARWIQNPASEETKKKMSRSALGRKASDATRKSISEGLKGRKKTDQERANIAVARRRYIEEHGAQRGWTLSAEAKRKIGDANRAIWAGKRA